MLTLLLCYRVGRKILVAEHGWTKEITGKDRNMKKNVLPVGSLSALLLSTVAAVTAHADLQSECKTVRSVSGREFLYKSEISNHIPSNDRRASGPTFICNQVCPSSWPLSVFYSDGALAARLGYYGTWNVTNKPRAYCAAGGTAQCYNSRISRDSRRNGRNGKLYVRTTNGSNSVCYTVNPVGRTGNPR
jgi:hypothetical protein